MTERRRARPVVLGVVLLVVVAVVAAVLVVRDRSGEDTTGPVAEGLPYSAPDVVNPMRGQFDNILTGLFPQSNEAQSALPDWPGTRDAAIRLTWRSLQPTDPADLDADAPDDERFDFSQIDRALEAYDARGMRVGLRISSYNSCCEQVAAGGTNLAVPDWVAATPGAVDRFDREGVVQVIPAWNDPAYLDPFEDLLAALGRRYDGDERLAIFEMSGYGDFSENQMSTLRDDLGAPGPAAQDSERVLGYYSQYRDQVITAAAAEQLVSANLRAFPRTQVVTSAQNPEITQQLLTDNPALADLAHPVGIRGDCLGVFGVLPTWATDESSEYVKRSAPIVETLVARLRSAPVLTEWCQLPDGVSPRDYYEQGVETVLTDHVSMTASSGFPDQLSQSPMDPALYGLWRRANVYAGYRYAAAADLAVEDGRVVGSARWTNYGVSSTHERWAVTYELRDDSGAVVATTRSGLDLREIDTEQDPGRDAPAPATRVDPVRFDTAVGPGTYTVTASVGWAEHKADASRTVDLEPMRLAMAGRVDGAYRIGTVRVSVP